jgi:hypothetical protein
MAAVHDEERRWLREFLDSGQPKNPGPYGGEFRYYRLAGERFFAFVQGRYGVPVNEARGRVGSFLEANGGREDVEFASREREVTGQRAVPPPTRYITLIVPVDAVT